MAVNAKVRILRFDPSVDSEPYEKEYEVTGFDTTSGPLSVLKALHWINNNIEPIAYDYNCRRASCALLRNGGCGKRTELRDQTGPMSSRAAR